MVPFSFWIILLQISSTSAIFWDVLNCPLCYLPRLEWPSAPYYPAYQPYSPPVAASPPVIYTQPAVVKYVRPVTYVYRYPPPQQQIITIQKPAASYQPQQTQPTYLRRGQGYASSSAAFSSGYGASSGGYGSSGTSAVFGSDAEFANSAPYAKKLVSAVGKSSGNVGRVNSKSKTTTEEPLVEWAGAQTQHKLVQEGHEGSEKNFHIHEEHGSKGKGTDDDLDDLDDTDMLRTGGKSGKSEQKEQKTEEMIGVTMPEKKEKQPSEMGKSEFIAIGKDSKKNKISRVRPASPPKNLIQRYKAQLEMTAALTAAWEQKKNQKKPKDPWK